MTRTEQLPVEPPVETRRTTVLGASIEALVDIAHQAPTPQVFLRRALPILAACSRCVYIRAEIPDTGTVIRESWVHPNSDPEFWSSTVQSFVTDTMLESRARAQLFEGQELDLGIAILSAPVGTGSRHGGALAVVVPCGGAEDAHGALWNLDVLCSLISTLLDSIGTMRDEPEPAHCEEVERARKVAAFASETELAFAIVNRLRTREGCEQVALAGAKGKKIEILAISGLDEVVLRSPGVKAIRSAMLECADLRMPVIDQDHAPHTSHEVSTGGRLHRRWRESGGGGCVASIPLFDEEQLLAVLSVRRNSSTPFQEQDLQELHALVEPYAASLELIRAARRSLPKHAWHSAGSALRALGGPGSWSRKAAVLLLVLGLGWCFWGSLPYSINAPCVLVPTESRHVAAGFDGVLKATGGFLPGDRVQAGDVLCEFEVTDLRLEAARLEAELAIIEVDLHRALGDGMAAEAELARARSGAVQAELNLIRHQLERSRVVAATGGVVLEGDLRDRIGDSFSKGEVLFLIAPGNEWKVEISVPEADIVEVETGSSGVFASHSRPEDRHDLEIVRVTPAAEYRDGRNVFVAEATCDLPDTWARSGMAGFASIDAGGRSPIWIATHRLVDFVRLHFWL